MASDAFSTVQLAAVMLQEFRNDQYFSVAYDPIGIITDDVRAAKVRFFTSYLLKF